jgi:hypothetical protein
MLEKEKGGLFVGHGFSRDIMSGIEAALAAGG